MSGREPLPHPDPAVRRSPALSEDPSLRELWSMVVARWRLIALVACVAAAGSTIGAVLVEPRHVYSSLIEIGIVNDRID